MLTTGARTPHHVAAITIMMFWRMRSTQWRILFLTNVQLVPAS
jgi:hypothetical protein